MKPADRLIVALDVGRVEEAVRLVKTLVPLGVTHFKVGLALFTQAGPAAVEAVHAGGGEVFLDLKFHDIPHTVGRAVETATRMGVWMTNVHIQGGGAMMRSAISAAREEARRRNRKAPVLVGVTVLTSMAEKDLTDLGVRKRLKDQVLYLAKQAKSAGLDGIVASAQEANVIRWACGDGFVIVTPGIRPRSREDPFSAAGASGSATTRPGSAAGASGSATTRPGSTGLTGAGKDDQQRTATPSEALRAGADYLVVGRPILEASDPGQMAREILQECEASSHATE